MWCCFVVVGCRCSGVIVGVGCFRCCIVWGGGFWVVCCVCLVLCGVGVFFRVVLCCWFGVVCIFCVLVVWVLWGVCVCV